MLNKAWPAGAILMIIHLVFNEARYKAALCGADDEIRRGEAEGHHPCSTALINPIYREKVCRECLKLWVDANKDFLFEVQKPNYNSHL